jgi:hypothetical protein
MRPIKLVTTALGAALVASLFLPFWRSQSTWEFLSATGWERTLLALACAGALAISGLALVQGRLGRWTALAIGVCFADVAVQTLLQFVPLFNDQAGPFSQLMDDGAIAAKILFFGGLAGLAAAAIGVLKPEQA